MLQERAPALPVEALVHAAEGSDRKDQRPQTELLPGTHVVKLLEEVDVEVCIRETKILG